MLDLLDVIYFLLGIVLLHYGSDLLVDNGSLLAQKYNISKMVIGMSLLAIGTSLPELLVSMIAIFKGKLDLVIGNVTGSNIANIGLVLGISGLIYSISCNFKKNRLDIIFMFSSTVMFLLILYFNQFNKLFGALLVLILIIYILILVKSDKIKDSSYDDSNINQDLSSLIIYLVIGIVALSIGSYSLVEGSISIARSFNISELVIGATAIALGTSLPELVTSLRAANRNEFELVLGNIFGSNIINIILVFGVSLLINDKMPVAKDFSLDIMVLLSLTILLILTLITGKIYKFVSGLFLIIYIYYVSAIL
tara:strand:+ start:302 stop:1228 length:927 start_codon:yes stop_codon:yes gene_type:complete